MERSYIFEKGSGDLNEDAILIDDEIIGVFDGATSLSGDYFEGGLTGGFIASNTARDIFSNNDKDLELLAFDANSAIQKKMIKKNVDLTKKTSLWSTSAAAVKIEGDYLNWVQIGDSAIIFIYEDGSFHMPVKNFNHDTHTLLMWKAMAGATDLSIQEALLNQIKKVRSKMNVSYGVLNGEPDFYSFLKSGETKLDNIKDILIFTDGLFMPSMDPKEDNFHELVTIYQDIGLEGLKNHIRSIEKKDPECRVYPRFKQHDDIAAVAVTL